MPSINQGIAYGSARGNSLTVNQAGAATQFFSRAIPRFSVRRKIYFYAWVSGGGIMTGEIWLTLQGEPVLKLPVVYGFMDNFGTGTFAGDIIPSFNAQAFGTHTGGGEDQGAWANVLAGDVITIWGTVNLGTDANSQAHQFVNVAPFYVDIEADAFSLNVMKASNVNNYITWAGVYSSPIIGQAGQNAPGVPAPAVKV